MLEVLWYKISLNIKDRDIAYLRFIIEGYEYLCFMDKCSRINDNINIYVTNYFFRDARNLFNDLCSKMDMKVDSIEIIDEDSIKLKYNKKR